jgi:hypothetical protein
VGEDASLGLPFFNRRQSRHARMGNAPTLRADDTSMKCS